VDNCNGSSATAQGPNPIWMAIGSLLGVRQTSAPTDKFPAAHQAIALNHQGIEAENAGNMALAASLFQRGLTLTPYDHVIRGNLADSMLGLANNFYNAGDYATAANYLQLALGLPPRPEERLVAQRLLVMSYNGLAQKAYNAGDVATAMSWLKKTQAVAPSDALSKNYIFMSYADMALKSYNSHDFGSAEILYRKALALQPNNPVIQHNLGNTYTHQALNAFNASDFATEATLLRGALASYPPNGPDRQITSDRISRLQPYIDRARARQEDGTASPSSRLPGWNAAPDNAPGQHGGELNPGARTAEGTDLARTAVANPPAPTASSTQELLRSAAGGESLNKLYDNGRANNDPLVAKTMNVSTPTSAAPPDPRLVASPKYWEAMNALATANATAATLNGQMKALAEEQQAHPTPERQIQISNLSGPVAAANGAASIAQTNLDTVKQTIMGPPIIVDGPAPAGSSVAPVPPADH
jgi:tetratricopeptide (TPR) repeat protein